MRILPLPLVELQYTVAGLADHAHRASKVTHGTVRAQVACALYSIIVRRLLEGAADRPATLTDARVSLRAI